MNDGILILYAYKSGSYEDHAHKGAEYARAVLEDLGITTKEVKEREKARYEKLSRE